MCQTSFPWSHNLTLIPLIQILGGGLKDLKKLKSQKKKRTNNKQNYKENFFVKTNNTVKATLWWTICPFKKYDLLFIAFFCHNTTGKFVGG